MIHNFKPGDLAIIVGAFNVPAHIGMNCELVERLDPEAISRWVDPGDGRRVQNSTGGAGWLVIGDNLTSPEGDKGCVLADERHLMPLRGDFAPEQQKSRAVSE